MMRPPVRLPNITLVVSSALVACHATEPLEPLRLEDAQSALFIGEREGAPAFAYALPVAEDGAVDIPPLASRTGDTWWALGNDCPLDALGLEDGGTVLSEVEAFDEIPIPTPTVVRSMSPSGDGAWGDRPMSDAVGDALRRLPLPEPETYRCDVVAPDLAFDTRTITLPERAQLYLPTFVTELGPDRFFATMIQGTYFDFVPTSTTGHSAFQIDFATGVATPFDIGPDPVVGGYRAPDGELWLATTTALLRGHPDTGFTTVTSLAIASPIRRGIVVGRGSGDEVDLLISTTTWNGTQIMFPRFVLRFVNGAVEVIDTNDRSNYMPVAAFVGSDEILVINFDDAGTVASSYRADEPEPRRVPIPEGPRFVQMLSDPVDGLFLRHSNRTIYRYRGGGFEEVAADVGVLAARFPTTTGEIFLGNQINPVSGRPAFGTVSVVQYLERTEACLYTLYEGSIAAVDILPLADPRAILATDLSGTPGQVRATKITLEGLADPCLLR